LVSTLGLFAMVSGIIPKSLSDVLRHKEAITINARKMIQRSVLACLLWSCLNILRLRFNTRDVL
jgi:hypothetical protein